MRGQRSAVAVRRSLSKEEIYLTQVREHDDRGSVAATGSSLVWPLGLLCVGIATVVNVGLFETADAAGISFHMKGQADVFETFQQLTTGFRDVVVTNVLINTAVPFLIGLALFRIALRRSVIAATTVLVAGVALTFASLGLPLSLRISDQARELLVRMHLVAGALFAIAVLPALILGARARD